MDHRIRKLGAVAGGNFVRPDVLPPASERTVRAAEHQREMDPDQPAGGCRPENVRTPHPRPRPPVYHVLPDAGRDKLRPGGAFGEGVREFFLREKNPMIFALTETRELSTLIPHSRIRN